MSRIEQIIDDIEAYIEDCKPSAFSSSKVVVNKEELGEMLTELRLQIPDEVRQYQKVISNQDAIISNAKIQAEGLVNEANRLQSQMVDEHEIMQKAYTNANKILENANIQAQDIVDKATNEAAAIKKSIMNYSDGMLESLQQIMELMMDNSKTRFGSFMTSLEEKYEIVSRNREDLKNSNQD